MILFHPLFQIYHSLCISLKTDSAPDGLICGKIQRISNMRIKRLIRNINMLNVVFLTGALFFAFYIFFPALDITAGFTLPAVKKSAAEKEETGMEIRIPSIVEYAKITEENLFHPERKIPVEKKADQQHSLAKPEFVLYGTTYNGRP